MDIELRAAGVEHARAPARWIRSPRELAMIAGATFDHPLNERQVRDRILSSRQLRRRPFAALDARSGAPVGYLELTEIEPRAGTAYLALVMVAPDLRDRGVGSTMVSLCLDRAFSALRLNRVGTRVFAENRSAIAFYERLGFVLEGALREAGRIGRRHADLVLLSILEREWRAREAALGSGRVASRR